jgi:hypothetical protein
VASGATTLATAPRCKNANQTATSQHDVHHPFSIVFLLTASINSGNQVTLRISEFELNWRLESYNHAVQSEITFAWKSARTNHLDETKCMFPDGCIHWLNACSSSVKCQCTISAFLFFVPPYVNAYNFNGCNFFYVHFLHAGVVWRVWHLRRPHSNVVVTLDILGSKQMISIFCPIEAEMSKRAAKVRV